MKGLFAIFALFSNFDDTASVSRSNKKGVVIPNWPRHHCFDFELFTTIRYIFHFIENLKFSDKILSWWYNYLPVPDAEYKTPYWCTYEDGRKPIG